MYNAWNKKLKGTQLSMRTIPVSIRDHLIKHRISVWEEILISFSTVVLVSGIIPAHLEGLRKTTKSVSG
jgi:hypothetical protein